MIDKSEECLVEAAQNGHLDSFAALYERYYNSMVALAYSVLADRHLSEDAAQQTFAIACRDLPRLNIKSNSETPNPRTYLLDRLSFLCYTLQPIVKLEFWQILDYIRSKEDGLPKNCPLSGYERRPIGQRR